MFVFVDPAATLWRAMEPPWERGTRSRGNKLRHGEQGLASAKSGALPG